MHGMDEEQKLAAELEPPDLEEVGEKLRELEAQTAEIPGVMRLIEDLRAALRQVQEDISLRTQDIAAIEAALKKAGIMK
ncbi:hypothetical protein OC539_25495 [Paracoccus denitrificans]|uniref:Uncharacterized protein n=2 Tax=Paracoccus denitrificans TaxID=266 RepID=A1B0P0_PARDP|nr:hypothetical protein [Paracoccus denitrificans]ABL69084.1 hypothetical protein Pden_0973 [Paracoccus denitrificans PD1222]MCU7431663.1 hypothetical protein [Paracoccus denitrificans]SDJ96091.1 hypothetical protein SAMN04244581_05148 [Paracoccus denitrificans]SFR23349.1 hypothetical protein SAMN04244569_05150 [Paracoccus denitrificans]GEK71394.1 hypothetical protein PDE01_49140 [Paracoccus denitrificans]